MKKKEIIGAILVALVFVGVAAGYNLINKDNSTKVVVKQKDKKKIL